MNSRKLQFFEAVKYLDNNNIVLFIELEQVLDIERLQQCIVRLAQSEPLFYTTIKKSLFSLKFKTQKDIVFPKLMIHREYGEAKLDELLDNELNEPLDVEHALFRLHYLMDTHENSSKLIFTFSHIMSDGVSSFLFVKELLKLYASDKYGEAIKACKQLPKSIEETLKLVHKEQGKKNKSFLYNFLHKKNQPKLKFPFYKKAKANERKTKVLTHVFDEGVLTSLINESKQLGCSINTLLAGKLYLLFHETLSLTQEPFEVSTLVDLRRLSKHIEHKHCLSFIASEVYTRHFISELHDFDRFMKSYDEQLREGLRCISYSSPALIPFARLLWQRYINGAQQGRDAYLKFSNMGRFDFDIENLNIKNMSLRTSIQYFGPLYLVLISTIEDRVTLTLEYVEPLVSEVQAENLFNKMLEELGPKMVF